MGWKKIPNVAQYGEGNWDNFVKKVSNLTAEEAMRIAFANSDITFFFFAERRSILTRIRRQNTALSMQEMLYSSQAFRGMAELPNAIRTRKRPFPPSTSTHRIISNFKRSVTTY